MTYPVSPAAPSGRHQAPTAAPQNWHHPEPFYGSSVPAQRGGDHLPMAGQPPRQGGGPGSDWWSPPPAPPDPRYYPGQSAPAYPEQTPGYPDQGWSQWPSQQDQAPPPPPAAPVPVYDPPHRSAGAWEKSALDDPRWADKRYRVASEIKHVIAKHVHEAFDRYGRRDALAPHGIILFYEMDRRAPSGQQYALFKAVRLFLDGPESSDLIRVLDDLRHSAEVNIARAIETGRRWDPRGPQGSMVNGGDLDMPRQARFLGVAVETLNTHHGDWYSVAKSVQSQPFGGNRTVFDLAGQGFVLLSDGTAMHVMRDPTVRVFGDDGIKSSRPLDISQARWHNRHANLMQQGDQPTQMTWEYLNMLHQTLGSYLLGGPAA